MKHTISIQLITGLLLVRVGALFAQPTPHANVINVEQALALNRQNAPVIQSRQRLVQQSVFGIDEARLGYRPKVILQAQAVYATSNQVRGAFFPNSGTAIAIEGGYRPNGTNGQLANGSPMVWSSFMTALMDWPIYDFGRTRSRVSVARAVRAQQQASLTNATFNQQVETADAYVSLLNSQQVRQIGEANLTRQTVLRDVTLARTRAGLQPGVDSALALADFAKAELQLLKARQQEAAQQLRLAELVGVPADSFVVQMPASFQTPPVSLNLTLDALNSHPALLLQQAKLSQGVQQADVYRHSYFPAIRMLAAGFMRGSGVGDSENLTYNQNIGAGLRPRVFDVMIGATLLWNITDVARVRQGYRAQQQENQSRYADIQTTQLELRRAFESATLNYETARQSLVDATEQQRANQQAYDQTLARYQSGLSSAVELSQTAYQLNQASIRRQQALYQNWQSLLSTAAADGSLTSFLQLIQ